MNLSEYTINTQNVIQDIVEQSERNIECFVENFETGFGVFTEDFTVDGDVVLRGPVGEESRSSESLITVDSGGVQHSSFVDVFVGSLFLFFRDKAI